MQYAGRLQLTLQSVEQDRVNTAQKGFLVEVLEKIERELKENDNQKWCFKKGPHKKATKETALKLGQKREIKKRVFSKQYIVGVGIFWKKFFKDEKQKVSLKNRFEKRAENIKALFELSEIFDFFRSAVLGHSPLCCDDIHTT